MMASARIIRMLICWTPALMLFVAFGARGAENSAATARQILDQTGVQGGLIVHLGCGDGHLTAA